MTMDELTALADKLNWKMREWSSDPSKGTSLYCFSTVSPFMTDFNFTVEAPSGDMEAVAEKIKEYAENFDPYAEMAHIADPGSLNDDGQLYYEMTLCGDSARRLSDEIQKQSEQQE